MATATKTATDRSLWFGLLAGPLAWSVQLVVDYALEEVIACTPGTGFTGTIWGVGVQTWVFVVNGVLGAVVVGALLVSTAHLRSLRTTDHSTGGRARWMAYAGVINSILFGIVIAVGFLPPVLLETCRWSP